LDLSIQVALNRRTEIHFHSGELAMETLLLVLIVLLAGAICALAGFWFHRATQECEQSAGRPQIARGASGNERWESALRASRDRS
jgi:hypothetical protein